MRGNEWNPARGRTGGTWRTLKPIVCPPGSCCWLCGKPIIFGLRRNHPLGPSIDHITSLHNGGHPTALGNLAPAHFGCNSRKGKGARTPPRPRSRDY